MTKTEKDIAVRLTILGLLTAVLILWMAASAGPAPYGIKASTIDIGETIRAYAGWLT